MNLLPLAGSIPAIGLFANHTSAGGGGQNQTFWVHPHIPKPDRLHLSQCLSESGFAKQIFQSQQQTWAMTLAKRLSDPIQDDGQDHNSQTAFKTKADIHALDPA